MNNSNVTSPKQFFIAYYCFSFHKQTNKQIKMTLPLVFSISCLQMTLTLKTWLTFPTHHSPPIYNIIKFYQFFLLNFRPTSLLYLFSHCLSLFTNFFPLGYCIISLNVSLPLVLPFF